ncbi:MAG: c-type cytochrome [Nitrospinota bacterium]
MKFLKPIIAILIGYLLLKYGIQFLGARLHPGTSPVVPASVMKMYMFVLVIGVLLIYTYSEEGYNALVGPILNLYSNPAKGAPRLAVVVLVGLFGAYVTYQYVKPSFEAPIELRSIHPAPPSSVKAWGKTFSLQTLKNPFRVEDKEQLEKNIQEGGVVFYKNCFYCHGDRMLGKGPFADGFNPLPANFIDVGTIAQLTESFVFWRISTGGPGLPSEGAPWISAMPVWHTILSEEEVWKATLFLYDYTGHHPRVTEAHGE